MMSRSQTRMNSEPNSATPERLKIVPELSGPRSLLRYARRPLRRFEDARAISGRAVAFEIFGIPYIAFFDPEAVETILVTRHAEFSKDLFTRDIRRVLGTGLLTSEGDLWRRRRKLAAPAFQRREIASYAEVMTNCARDFALRHPENQVFDVHSAMMHLTLDILVRSLFGTQISRASEVHDLLEALMTDYIPWREALRVALPEWVPVPSRRRLAKISSRLDEILHELIEEKKRHPGTGNDLLTRLMHVQDEAGNLSDAALRDEAMTLFLAGHETTALALTYVLRLLAQHPAEAAKLREEVDRVLGSRPATFADSSTLPYTRAVLDEALRLFPPAWGLGREALVDTVVSGVFVPRGTQVLLAPWVMHRDPRFFDEPERFWPERWLGGASELPRYVYLPFGAGPRVCIGNHFALVEAVLALASFTQLATFTLEPQQHLRLLPAITLRPVGPVYMRLHRRAQAS